MEKTFKLRCDRCDEVFNVKIGGPAPKALQALALITSVTSGVLDDGTKLIDAGGAKDKCEDSIYGTAHVPKLSNKA